MAYWLALCPAKCLKPCCFSQCPLPSLSHSPSLHFHLFSLLSLPLFLPRYESWLSSQPIPLAVIRGFGFQPACISRPGGSGKNSHLFQSNKEWLVRAIQICETSKRTSCTQLLWWKTKTKRNIKSKGGGLLVKWKPAPLPGAKKMSSLMVRQPGMDVIFLCLFLISVHSITLFPQLIALVSLELLTPALCFYIYLHDVLI